MTKLLYIDPYPVPAEDTVPLQVLQNIDALARQGADITLLTPEPGKNIAVRDILGRDLHPAAKLVHLPDFCQCWWYPSGSNFLFYRRAVDWLRDKRFDAVLVRNLKLAERLLNGKIRIPLFFETHEIFAQTFFEDHPGLKGKSARKYRQLQRRERCVYANATGLIALTALLAEDIQTVYQVSTPIVVASDGVDSILAGQSTAAEKNAVPVALYLGSLHPWKGVETLIQAMPMVNDGVLWIAGGGEKRIQELTTLAEKLEVAHRVRFLGAVAPLKRFELIAQADICLLPLSLTSIASRYTSPLKLFEYMAKSKPIVVADLPSIREVLTDGQDALLVPPEDPCAFAQALNRLFADALLRERLGTAAGVLAEQYSWESRVGTIHSFITGLLEQNKQYG